MLLRKIRHKFLAMINAGLVASVRPWQGSLNRCFHLFYGEPVTVGQMTCVPTTNIGIGLGG